MTEPNMTRSYADIADRLLADAGPDACSQIRGLLIEAAVQAVGEYVHDQATAPATSCFACDKCQIELGQPSSPAGWKAP